VCQLDAVTADGDSVNRKGGYEGGYHDERASKILTVQKIQSGHMTLSTLQTKEMEINHRSEELDTRVNEILSQIQNLESEKSHRRANHSQITRELGARIRQHELGKENLTTRKGMIESVEREIKALTHQIEEYENEMRIELNTALTPGEREELALLTARCPSLEVQIMSLSLP
jgi:chromosome segregation ATPase